MVGSNLLLPGADCEVLVIAENYALGEATPYFSTADCTGTAYTYGVGDNCSSGPPAVAGQPETLLRRVSPMVLVPTTLASSFQSGACQAFAGGTTVYSMFSLTSVTLPPLTPPFRIVTQ